MRGAAAASGGLHARLGGRPGVARVAQVLRVAGGHGSAWDVALLLEEGRGRPDDRLEHNQICARISLSAGMRRTAELAVQKSEEGMADGSGALCRPSAR